MELLRSWSVIHAGGGPRRRAWLAPAAASLVVLVAACTSPGAASPSSTASSSGTPASIQVATTSLGKVLVDGEGNSLYLFEADTGTQSTCSDECAAAWPPLLTSGTPTVSGDATQSMVGTTTRTDGGVQVTYDGHPLYYYSGDKKAGDINGEGSKAFGAEWYLVSPKGATVEEEEDESSDESSSESAPAY
jgi:predicted lipoprotein with Yx(FWY)xxD motif